MTAKSNDSTERRRFQRISLHKPLRMEADGKIWETALLDISIQGILLEKPSGYLCEKGRTVQITIPLGETEKIEMDAHTVHCEDDKVGCAWDQIDVDSLDHLRRMLELNLGDASLVQRELQELFNRHKNR
ncbi:MAG: PilZ domain-containing protein [bacterium]